MNEEENKEQEKQPPQIENTENDDFDFLDNEDEISPELDQFMKEQEEAEESNDYDDLMNDWEDEEIDDLNLDDIEEEETDPLAEFEGEPSSDIEEPPTEKVEQVKERISSKKNRKNLERLGAKFLDKADFFKASLCSKLGGQHIAEYVADDEMKEILIECIKEYLATKEVSELSPFGALMAALAMWTLPPLGVALLDRFQLKKEEKEANKKKTSKSLNQAATEITEVEEDQEAEGEAKTDYSHLKEVQEGRKMFTLNAEGKYNRTAKGTYVKVDLANEYPSPEVQELIDQGHKDREIKRILGYG